MIFSIFESEDNCQFEVSLLGSLIKLLFSVICCKVNSVLLSSSKSCNAQKIVYLIISENLSPLARTTRGSKNDANDVGLDKIPTEIYNDLWNVRIIAIAERPSRTFC